MEEKKTYVEFTCNKTEYKRFDRARPYFVVKDGGITSCHESYEEAARLAPYTGIDSAGKKGGPSMTTSEMGLHNQGIENPIPPAEEKTPPPAEIKVPSECFTAPWDRDRHGMWKQEKRKKVQIAPCEKSSD